MLRIDFGELEEGLAPIERDEFFGIFESDRLAFLHQDKIADGSESRFNRFMRRDD